MKLSEAQERLLRKLAYGGGSGYLDKHSRVVIAGEVCPQGSWPSWMHLLAKGLITGGEGRISVTEYGMRHAKPTIAKAEA
jgi:hypothetical protein